LNIVQLLTIISPTETRSNLRCVVCICVYASDTLPVERRISIHLVSSLIDNSVVYRLRIVVLGRMFGCLGRQRFVRVDPDESP